MKWHREKPGHYSSGPYHIEGAGYHWKLRKGNRQLTTAKSKKECQQFAETHAEEVVAPEPPREESRKKKSTGEDLDSVLASLRLEIDALAMRISSLDDAIRKNTESQEGLTQAILILGRHVGKLGK